MWVQDVHRGSCLWAFTLGYCQFCKTRYKQSTTLSVVKVNKRESQLCGYLFQRQIKIVVVVSQVVFELAESVVALQLSNYCLMFALEHFRDLAQSLPEPVLLDVSRRMVPQLKKALLQQLTKEPEDL